jgi:hypothetical protein
VANATPWLLYTGKEIHYPLCRRVDRLQGWSGWVRNILPPMWFNSRTIQPIVSHYTEYAIPVHRRCSIQTQRAWFKLTSLEPIWLWQCGIVSGNHITPSYFYKLMGVFQTTCTGRQLHSSCQVCRQKHENQVDSNKPNKGINKFHKFHTLFVTITGLTWLYKQTATICYFSDFLTIWQRLEMSTSKIPVRWIIIYSNLSNSTDRKRGL